MTIHDRHICGYRAAAAPALALGPGAATGAGEVWILQRGARRGGAAPNPNTLRLVEALTTAGLTPRPVNPERVDLSRGADALRLGGRPIARPAAVLGRSGSTATATARRLSAMLETAGAPAFPSARALALAGDKAAAGRLLARCGLPVPATEEVGPGTDAHALGARLGWPLVVKAARGSKGRSVRLVEGPEGLARAIAALLGQGPILAQRCLAESRGRDVRVMVVGGRAIGAMAREATRPGAFHANIAAGGVGRALALSPRIARLAEAAATASGLDIAGVDLLHAGDGFAICEVNSAPGFVAFEAVTGIDVAGAMAGHIARCLGERWGDASC